MEEFMDDVSAAELAGDEFTHAVTQHGIIATVLDGQPDWVTVEFEGIEDASLLMTLVFEGESGPGSMYDRASGGCVTFGKAHRLGVQVDEQLADRILANSWSWIVHPDMSRRRVGWHVVLCLPVDDALTVAACLNELRNGVAL